MLGLKIPASQAWVQGTHPDVHEGGLQPVHGMRDLQDGLQHDLCIQVLRKGVLRFMTRASHDSSIQCLDR